MEKEQSWGETKDNDVSESKNTTLFSVIRSKLSSAEKLKKFTQYLKQGADVNYLDANDKNNTILHVATIYGEVEIVKLLLNKNVDATITNDDNDTVLDIVQLLDTPKQFELATILYKKYGYQKRPGTSGVRGELYETKLLSLILFRAIYDENIKEFILGTNLDDIGALDDIILRYDTKDPQKTEMLFLQAKHRENEIITVDDLLNPKKETNLHKYFESYVRVRHKFITDNDNTMFQGAIKNIDCKFIIYTSAKQYSSKNQNTVRSITLEEIQDSNKLINASKTGKVLQLKYANEFNDLTEFVSSASRTRALALAQSVVKFLVKDNTKYKNMMLDNIIKEYHIYLAQNIVETNGTLNDAAMNSNKAKDFLIGQFRSSFLTSNNENLQLIKFEIHKELREIKGLSPNSDQNELNNIMRSFTFKLPTDFGNHHFSFGGNKTKQQNKLTHLCLIFEKILQSTSAADSTDEYIYVHLDDNSVGPGGIIQSKDLGNYWLGGLVGNLLIHDKDTEMLKFNLIDQSSLSEDNTKIIQELKKKRNDTLLTMFRFNVNYLNFPKLTINSKPCRENDRKLVKHFVDNLRIYTNQAKEDEVEQVLKDEIYMLYLNRKSQSDFLFHIKCDAIFLTVHDNIQKWWKQPNSAPYLTEKCKFYQEVEREILDSPVLSVVHFICCKIVTNSLVEFETEAMKSFKLSEFLRSSESITIIESEEINFSSIKVIKYLNENEKQIDYKLINFNHEIVETCYDIIINELENSIPITSTLVVVSKGITDDEFWRLLKITNIFKGKIIIITNNRFKDKLKVECQVKLIYRDTTNNFSNLSRSVRKMILEEREIIFQGFTVIVNSVLCDYALDLFSPTLIWKIIHKNKIIIGNKLDILNELLGDRDGVTTNFIKRKISRVIAINTNKDDCIELCFKEDNDEDYPLEQSKDLVVISDSEDKFKQICQIHNQTNMHWFTRMNIRDEIIWNKSKGTLKNLIKYVHRSVSLPIGYQYTTKLKNLDYKVTTLKETQDRIVIINAEPGMGKSTLLTYLAMNTKQSYPNLWILKINLLDSQFLDQFSDWSETKLNIDMFHVMMFLYSAIDKIYYTNKDIFLKISKLISINNLNEIHISDSDEKNLHDVDLSEIKLLNYFYNHNKLVVLLDGFDEICPDYTDEVVQLLNILKTSKVTNLWITSRPYNGVEKLELALETFSFTLDPLNMREQMMYLQNVWSKKFCRDKPLDIRKKIYISISEVFTVITDALDDDMKFTSIPLHLYMISEIYENLLKQCIDYRLTDGSVSQNYMLDLKSTLNFITLYEKFTKKKFHMQFEEKNNCMNSKDPYIKKLKQDAYKLFIKNHKNIAAYLLLDKNSVLSEYDIESIQDFMIDLKSDSEKTGIIKCIDNNPKFVHYTFAEYFVVEFIFDKLLSDKSCKLLWQYMIENILITRDKQGIRKFINSKLHRGQHIITSLISKEEHMATVFSLMLTQFKHSLTSALFVAIEESFEYIAVFLIKCIKAPVNKDNIFSLMNILHKKCNKYCVICMALTRRNKSVIKHFIELFTKIDYNRDLFSENKQDCVSLNALLQLDQLAAQTIEQFLTKHSDVWVPTDTAHYVLGRHGFYTILCHEYISKFSKEQRLQLFNDENFKNSTENQVPEKINYDWVTTRSISREEFVKICANLDISTIKSIMLMLQKNIIKLYEKPDANVEDFIFKTIPKLELKFAEATKRRNISKVNSYQSQLQYLVLLRLLFDEQIKEFTLTSSIKDIGKFDDVVLKYRTDESSKSKMVFLHMTDFFKQFIDDDFLIKKLFKYFQSYLLIREKFITDNENVLFQESMKDIDCKFIIHTTNTNNLSKNFTQNLDENSLFKTNDDLKIFHYKYTKDDVETLASHLCNSRAHDLGIYISRSALNPFIKEFKMEDDLMKIYHIFIAEKIIKIDSLSDESRKFSIGRFRSSFLTSDAENLGIIRNQIYQYYVKKNGLNSDILINADKIKSIRFPLPVNFGEYSFSFNEDEAEQQKNLDRLLSIFQNLCKNPQQDDSEYTIIKIDDSSISFGNNLQIKDLLEIDSLAGLVGNLLVFDKEIEALKINFNHESLSKDNVKILDGLKQNFDALQLSKFRFDININGFPKLTLNKTEYDRTLAYDFLNSLQFYTNQANDDEIEDLLKQHLNKYFNVLKKHNDFLFRVKCDAIFFSYLSMREENDTSWRNMYSTEYDKHKKLDQKRLQFSFF